MHAAADDDDDDCCRMVAAHLLIEYTHHQQIAELQRRIDQSYQDMFFPVADGIAEEAGIADPTNLTEERFGQLGRDQPEVPGGHADEHVLTNMHHN